MAAAVQGTIFSKIAPSQVSVYPSLFVPLPSPIQSEVATLLSPITRSVAVVDDDGWKELQRHGWHQHARKHGFLKTQICVLVEIFLH